LIRYSARSDAHYVGAVRQKSIGKESALDGISHDATVKEITMNIRKLSIVLLAGIATLVTVIEPSLAAQRKHRAYDAYASGAAADRSGAYYYGPNSRGYDAFASGTVSRGPARSEALTPAQHNYDRYNYGQNLPYPDRPYGAPDSW
jgi:hypothetical protein